MDCHTVPVEPAPRESCERATSAHAHHSELQKRNLRWPSGNTSLQLLCRHLELKRLNKKFWFWLVTMLPVVSNCTRRVRNFCAEQTWSLILHLLQVEVQKELSDLL